MHLVVAALFQKACNQRTDFPCPKNENPMHR
jgi:hypothetical protein